MNDIVRNRLDMFIRVREHAAARAAQFPPTSFAGEQISIIKSVIDNLENHMSAQESGRISAQQGSLSRAAARDEVLRDLEALSRTARAIAQTNPHVSNLFRVPHHKSDQEVLTTARAALSAALPLKAEFIKRGMPADFLEDLQADIEAMEEAIAHKAQGHESHVNATAAIDDEVESGMGALRELDPIMRNTYANDPASLAAWTSASHVERPPRNRTKQPEQPNP